MGGLCAGGSISYLPLMGSPPPDLSGLPIEEIKRLADAQQQPPIESWAPERCGTSGISIMRDGRWLHEGKPIRRPEMVQLFSKLLRREPDGRIFLVTPAEKLEVEVEDTPFLAVEARSDGEGTGRTVAFRLNSGDLVLAGSEHRIRIEADERGIRPLLEVRRGLDALIARPVYYELAETALREGSHPPGLWSRGLFFPMDVER